ncbi:MAG: quinone-dependent dihydroorotate dehydrogenase [Rikenellaceae bacterium]
MYKHIIKPLLFCFNAETAHKITFTLLKSVSIIPGAAALMRKRYEISHPSLEREVFGIKFKNPVGLAAGLDKNASLYSELSTLGFGFIEVGTITPKAQLGNPKPRLFRVIKDSAIINRMGFNNFGVENARKNLKKTNRPKDLVIGGNLGKNTLTPNENAAADYLDLFRKLYDHVDYFVVNVSCPNIANLGKLSSGDSLKEILMPLIEFRKGNTDYRPILLKISPDLSFEQIDDAAETMKACNLDGIVATNTTTKRTGLSLTEEEIENIGNGGLSGKPLTQRAIEVVSYVHEKCEGQYPIIGVGGIMTEDDAVNMLKAGASLVQIYSGFIFNGPAFVKRICKRVINYNVSNPTAKV